jgi:hypothetical protein
LGLVWEGQPEAWARKHLHHAVNPDSWIDGPNDGGGKVQSRTVTINLYEGGGWVVDHRGQRGRLVLPARDPVGFTAAFWDELREIARRAAVEAVDDLRDELKASYPVRYEATWGHPATEETEFRAKGSYLYCERLACWLKGECKPSHAQKARLVEMAKLVRVDHPRKQKRTILND